MLCDPLRAGTVVWNYTLFISFRCPTLAPPTETSVRASSAWKVCMSTEPAGADRWTNMCSP